MVLRNRDSIDVENITVTVFAEEVMDGPRLCFRLPVLGAEEESRLELHALLSEKSLQITTDKEIAVRVTVAYWRKGKEETGEYRGRLTVHSRNALTWVDDFRIAGFVTSQDSEILRLSRNVMALSMDSMVSGIDPTIQKLLAFHQLLKDAGIRYLVDPVSPYADRSEVDGEIDFVQFPVQTLINRAGDCDDLSVLYAALLEAAGAETAFITVPGHIFIAAALEAPPNALVSRQGVIEAEGRFWVPLEATALEGHFLTAWTAAMNEWTSAGEEARLFTLKQAGNATWRLRFSSQPIQRRSETRLRTGKPVSQNAKVWGCAWLNPTRHAFRPG